jgi:hypothetical protein
MMKAGVRISVIEAEQGIVIVRVQGSNGVFSGHADVWLDPGKLIEFAEVLRGFPDTPADTRAFELGHFEANHPDGAAGFRFYCLNSRGHTSFELRLRNRHFYGADDIAAFHIGVFEGAAIDMFVKALERMEEAVGQTAALEVDS